MTSIFFLPMRSHGEGIIAGVLLASLPEQAPLRRKLQFTVKQGQL
jgi:hypothetical protein